MARLGPLLALILGFSALVPGQAMAADDPCGDLANQVAMSDHELDQARLTALGWLQQAGQSAPLVLPDLVGGAVQGSIPDLTPELAQTHGALVAQVGVEMQGLANSADTGDAASFLTQLGDRLSDWQARLALVRALAPYSAGLQSFDAVFQTLMQSSAEAQASLAIHDVLSKQLATCQQTNPSGGATQGCGLTYYGLDRSGTQPSLRPAVPGLRPELQSGDQWDDQSTADVPTRQGETPIVASVTTVDTYRCVPDGATKVGRTAVETLPDGSTIAWGERNYVGTLWPKTISPGATWQWHAVQYSKDPDGVQADYEEIWNVAVADVGREMLALPEGSFEAIQLHLEEDILQPDAQTQHFSWDEWYARPR
jgi:hypothetical protein